MARPSRRFNRKRRPASAAPTYLKYPAIGRTLRKGGSAITVATQTPRHRGERLEARVSRETKALFERAAALAGRSLTDFLVTSGVEAATRVIREREFLDLTERDRTAFVTTLLAPAPTPNARLRKAAERHRQLLG